MNVTKLIELIWLYKRNSAYQGQVPWDKMADCDAIFEEMCNLGLCGVTGSCGTFFGVGENGRKFAVGVTEEGIFCGYYDNIFELLR